MSNEEISKRLGTPFPKTAIKTRRGGGGKDLSYVEGHTVIHRLNEATGNTWDLDVREITTLQLGNRIVLQARVALTIPGLGTREHIGVQEVNERGGEDLVKGVVTDALKKAATLFGVGLELYGPDYEAGEIAQPAQRQQPHARNNAPVRYFESDNDGSYPDAPVRPQNAPQRQEAPRQASSPQRTEQAATPRQVQFIKAIARELGMSPEQIEAESSQSFSRAIDQLNRRDASIFIERLQQRRAERPTNINPALSGNDGPPEPSDPGEYEEVVMFNAGHADRFTN